MRPKSRLLLKLLGVLVLALTLWRYSLPSLRTSPEAVVSYQRKMAELKQAHERGFPATVRVSAIELNSEIEDWYRRERIDVGWPPWGTVYYFRDDRAGICFGASRLGFRIVVVDIALSPRGNVLVPRSSLFWFAILPIPGRVVDWTARRFFGAHGSPRLEDWPLKFPDYVTHVRVENGELALETR